MSTKVSISETINPTTVIFYDIANNKKLMEKYHCTELPILSSYVSLPLVNGYVERVHYSNEWHEYCVFLNLKPDTLQLLMYEIDIAEFTQKHITQDNATLTIK